LDAVADTFAHVPQSAGSDALTNALLRRDFGLTEIWVQAAQALLQNAVQNAPAAPTIKKTEALTLDMEGPPGA
jgi:hypothetical protein